MIQKRILGESSSRDIRFVDQLPVVFKGMLRAFNLGEKNGVPSVHATHELTYLRKGSARFTIGGKNYHLTEGQTFVIKPHVTHSFYIQEEDTELAVLYFDFAALSGETSQQAKIVPPESTPLNSFLNFIMDDDLDVNGDPVIILEGRGGNDIAEICERILYEENHREIGKGLLMQAIAVELLVVFSRALHEQWQENLRVQTGKAEELVEIAKEFIDLNYTKSISVSDIAGHVFLSPGYFARAFREVMDISPMNYLVQLRVKKACELLEEDDLKISSIAIQVGFSSPQRFNAAFRKIMNMTPMEYRKAHTEVDR